VTVTPEDDWTPVAQSSGDPVAVVVLPSETFELDELRSFARSLEDAGFPVLVAESADQRRIFILALAVVPIIIHISPAMLNVLEGVAASAAWDGIKSAFDRLARREQPGDAGEPSELTIDLQVDGNHLVASARGPAAEALAELARELSRHGGAEGGTGEHQGGPEGQAPVNTKPPQ
jgi:hypothetical protein